MKRKYSAPEIVFENFSLNTHIAGECEIDTNIQSKGLCGLEVTATGVGTVTIYIDSTTGCTTETDDGDYNELCYHVPTEYNNLFNS